MTIAFTQVDAFAATAFAGNPAGVCVLKAPLDPTVMAAIARETNLPATAFVQRNGDGFDLRWFTVTSELELCGHGTLASAHVLFETAVVPPDAAIRFQSRGGVLTAVRQSGWIELNFPAVPEAPAAPPPGLLEALGADAVYVGRGRLDYLVHLTDEAAVRGLKPDLTRLRDVNTRGVIVTSQSATTDRDFVSRFFAPSTGIPEDSVTGSAHCCLAPYWAKRLNRTSFTAHQLSARGGVLKLTLDGDRVRIAGQAVTVLRGELIA